jgi:hypothetical protein
MTTFHPAREPDICPLPRMSSRAQRGTCCFFESAPPPPLPVILSGARPDAFSACVVCTPALSVAEGSGRAVEGSWLNSSTGTVTGNICPPPLVICAPCIPDGFYATERDDERSTKGASPEPYREGSAVSSRLPPFPVRARYIVPSPSPTPLPVACPSLACHPEPIRRGWVKDLNLHNDRPMAGVIDP